MRIIMTGGDWGYNVGALRCAQCDCRAAPSFPSGARYYRNTAKSWGLENSTVAIKSHFSCKDFNKKDFFLEE